MAVLREVWSVECEVRSVSRTEKREKLFSLLTSHSTLHQKKEKAKANKNMNNKEFLTRLATKTGYSAEDTQKLVQSVLKAMGKSLENGDTIQVNAFGLFEVKKRLERVITNPGTGQKMLVPPKLVLNFKPNTTIKELVRKGGENNG